MLIQKASAAVRGGVIYPSPASDACCDNEPATQTKTITYIPSKKQSAVV